MGALRIPRWWGCVYSSALGAACWLPLGAGESADAINARRRKGPTGREGLLCCSDAVISGGEVFGGIVQRQTAATPAVHRHRSRCARCGSVGSATEQGGSGRTCASAAPIRMIRSIFIQPGEIRLPPGNPQHWYGCSPRRRIGLHALESLRSDRSSWRDVREDRLPCRASWFGTCRLFSQCTRPTRCISEKFHVPSALLARYGLVQIVLPAATSSAG